MACNECVSHGLRASSLATPFAAKAAQERAQMSARERMRGFNCADGGKVLTITQRITILAAADGASFTAFDPNAGPIDYLRLAPYGNQQVRLHGLVFSGVGPSAAATAVPAAGAGNVDNSADIGIGEIRLSGKEVRPTFQGSLLNHRSSGFQFQCSFAACGVDPSNSGCLPAFNSDNPLDVGLVNFPAAAVIAVDVSVMLEYMGIAAA